MSYTNEDRDGLDWPDATQQVIDGNAAFNVMGDWAVAAFEEAGKKAPADYVYMPVPGTDGVFDFLADSFTLPVGAPHPAGAKAWLKTIGSLDGQVAFNKAKGSIPARNDAKPEDFSEYQQSAMDVVRPGHDRLLAGARRSGPGRLGQRDLGRHQQVHHRWRRPRRLPGRPGRGRRGQRRADPAHARDRSRPGPGDPRAGAVPRTARADPGRRPDRPTRPHARHDSRRHSCPDRSARGGRPSCSSRRP